MTGTTVLVWVGVGLIGGIGSVTRFLVDRAVTRQVARPFPIGTLAVNVSGAGLLGFLGGLALSKDAALLTGIPQLANAVFRPKAFKIRQPTAAYEILISWSDGKRHRGEITLEYVRDIDKP